MVGWKEPGQGSAGAGSSTVSPRPLPDTRDLSSFICTRESSCLLCPPPGLTHSLHPQLLTGQWLVPGTVLALSCT